MPLKPSVAGFAMAFLLGCSSGVPIAISNQSGQTLRNLTLSGSGFRQQIASIPAGETVRVRVHPKGETGVAIAFDLGEKKISHAEAGYVEGSGYRVEIGVDAAGKASVHTELARY